MAEGLHGLLRKAVAAYNFYGFRARDNRELEVSILQFSDDTLFFGEATLQNVRALKCMLRCFELAYGLKVNFQKGIWLGYLLRKDIFRVVLQSFIAR